MVREWEKGTVSKSRQVIVHKVPEKTMNNKNTVSPFNDSRDLINVVLSRATLIHYINKNHASNDTVSLTGVIFLDFCRNIRSEVSVNPALRVIRARYTPHCPFINHLETGNSQIIDVVSFVERLVGH